MRLNDIKPAKGSKPTRKRVGRGIGSGFGKTCGRGHKGQKARSGGFHKTGFEGGQMPIHRRLPKRGFSSRVGGDTQQVLLSQIENLGVDVIDLESLKEAGVVTRAAKQAKLIKTGELSRKVTINGLLSTKGARAAVEAAGGTISE